MVSKRFEILDLFRFLAILMVMFFHYFSRWCDSHNEINLYPYNTKYDYFLWGRMGVQFFFIISGFVIYMTLERSLSLLDFAKKRMVRLWPSMIFISTITYLVFVLFDNTMIFKKSHELGNLFYSWTFLGKSFGGGVYTYIDGSYWSLWVEIQFYILSALLYFLLKKSKTPHFFPFILFALSVLACFLKPFMASFNQTFDLFLYFNFFVMGVVFKELYRSENPWSMSCLHWHFILGALLLLEWIFYADDGISKMLDGFFIFAFYAFIFLSKKNWSPKNPVFSYFVFLGEASYISYLLHQYIGVLIINKIGYTGKFDFMVPIGVIVFIFGISGLLYNYFEKPVMGYLKKKVLNTQA